MKIKCDVCDKEEASVFCFADEAALCEACDHRVHHANKLASKHPRFSIVHPSFKDSPRCDICQDRRARLFCQEDRALLCTECDIPIHKANVHTQNHSRFLLTGIKLSAPTSSHQTFPSSSVPNAVAKSRNEIKISSRTDETFRPKYSTVNTSDSTSNPCSVDSHCIIEEGSVSTSSISEYLLETLPGWHVEDFLDPSSCSPHGFCKTLDQMSPFTAIDAESTFGNFSLQDLAIWDLNVQNGMINEELKDTMKVSRKWNRDDYRVPQISPPFF